MAAMLRRFTFIYKILHEIHHITLDRSTPVIACTAGGSSDNSFVTSLVVRSESPSSTISSIRDRGAETSAAI